MRIFRRGFSFLVCLLLLFSLPAAGRGGSPTAGSGTAAPSAGQPTAESAPAEAEITRLEATDDETRFGFAAKPERDETGRVVRVNGYPSRIVRAGFNSIGYASALQYVTDFMEYPFWNPATVYDGNLAVMSVVMALSANRASGYNNIRSGNYDPSRNVVAYLEDAGFGDIRRDDYSKVPTMYTVSTAIGARRMEAEGQDPFTLIAVGVCGAGYNNEWISNLTPGEGQTHEGFTNAAGLVVDRISGYIATRGIKGRIKIWISGFSRAAAVSNLTAGILTDTGMFSKEDVFAYTFATPAAVMNPPETGYENIFNIINPVDPVPQVMPADWGYGRYGTDLYLPTEEFSSFAGEMARELREETNRLAYGVENRYSGSLNFRTRLIYSLLLNLVDSRENYNRLYQPTLAGLLENRTIPSALTTLRALMRNLRDLGPADRDDLDELMDFTARVVASVVTHSGLGPADLNRDNPFLLLFNEHRENSYLASAHVMRSGLLEPNTVSWYCLVRGPVSVIAHLEADEEAPMLGCGIDSRGKPVTDEALVGPSRGADLNDILYLERIGNTTVAAIPLDIRWNLRWIAEEDGEVDCLLLCMRARATTDYEVYTMPGRRVRAGDSAPVLSPVTAGDRLPEGVSAELVEYGLAAPAEGFEKGVMEARQVAEFLGIASVGINWRAALMILCGVLGGIACGIICLAASRNPRRRKRYSPAVWLLLCTFGIAVLEAEAAYWFFADRDGIRLLWKGLGALSLAGVFFLTRRPEEKGSLLHSPLPALILALAADMAFSLRPAVGMILLLLFHGVLCARFLRTAPLSGKRWIQWGLLSLAVGAAVAMLVARRGSFTGWAAAAVVPAALLTAFAAAKQASRVRFAVQLFLLWELLMGFEQALSSNPLLHVLCAALFAAALLLLALSPMSGRPLPGMNPLPEDSGADVN